MKKLIVLPGNSPRNQVWGEGCATHYAQYFDETRIAYYTHWETGEKVMNIETELAKLQEMIAADPETADWYIFAKSLGSLLALEAVANSVITPVQNVFFGMPLDMAAEDMYQDDWSVLEEYSVPTLAFHNEHDPVAGHDFAKEKIEALTSTVAFITLGGDTHDYLDFADYEAQVAAFIS